MPCSEKSNAKSKSVSEWQQESSFLSKQHITLLSKVHDIRRPFHKIDLWIKMNQKRQHIKALLQITFKNYQEALP